MANAPYGVRLLVGAATVAVEETMKLPKTILMYPMTLASQAAHLVMRFQQNLAELVIKGDSTLESIFPPKDEKPEWATFDEDLPGAIDGAGYALATAPTAIAGPRDGSPCTRSRKEPSRRTRVPRPNPRKPANRRSRHRARQLRSRPWRPKSTIRR